MRTVGVLKPLVTSDAANAETRTILREYYHAARSLRVTLHVEDVQGPDAFDHAFATMKKERVDAVMLIPNPLLFAYRARLIELSAKMRLPLMGWSREFSDDGAVLAYGANNAQMICQAASYVARILHGAKPADLPVQQPTTFELVINLKTAKALGLTIPPSLLQRADQVTE